MNHWSKALVLGAGLAAVAVAAIAKDESGHARREILQRQDVAGTNREGVIGTAELPAGGAIGRHAHPGEELSYVLKGPVVMKVEGQPDKMLRTGESYAIPAGVVHDATAGESGAKVVGVWIIEKGQPLSKPAG